MRESGDTGARATFRRAPPTEISPLVLLLGLLVGLILAFTTFVSVYLDINFIEALIGMVTGLIGLVAGLAALRVIDWILPGGLPDG